MNPRNKSKLVRGQRFTDKIFQPYVTAIGELALAWNDLHEKLGWLFYLMIDVGTDRAALLWNAANFDRARRQILEATTRSMSDMNESDFPRLKDDILWLLKEVDKLEEARNNAVHSPLRVVEGDEVSIFEGITIRLRHVKPNLLLKNSRAAKLEQKELLTEFRWCRDAALVLRDFALSLDMATSPEDFPWPDRPSLPNRGHRKKRPTGPRLAH